MIYGVLVYQTTGERKMKELSRTNRIRTKMIGPQTFQDIFWRLQVWFLEASGLVSDPQIGSDRSGLSEAFFGPSSWGEDQPT